MIRIILNDLWLELKKNALCFLVNIVAYLFLTALAITVILTQFISNMQTYINGYNQQAVIALLSSPDMQIYKNIISSVTGIILLISTLKKIPIRLSKPLYICAAGVKEKMRYLRLHLWIKVLLSFVLFYSLQKLAIGGFVFAHSLPVAFVQLGLLFFLLLSLNLRIDPGNRKEALAISPTWESEKSGEVVADVYWFLLLLLENGIFYTLVLLNVTWNLWILLIWIVLFAINVVIAKYCITPVLSYMLSYEKIYYPLMDKKE